MYTIDICLIKLINDDGDDDDDASVADVIYKNIYFFSLYSTSTTTAKI